MEFLRFIFSSFWIWLGFVLLVALIAQQAVEMVKAIRPPKRAEAYRIGTRWQIKIEGATRKDIAEVMRATGAAAEVDAKEGVPE